MLWPSVARSQPNVASVLDSILHSTRKYLLFIYPAEMQRFVESMSRKTEAILVTHGVPKAISVSFFFNLLPVSITI